MSENYFNSYEDLEVHRLMLEDGPRVRAYKSAIMNQKELFEGRCVMDVGAGSGILSVFCAQAGARKVIAVEASALAKLAEQIIAENEVQHIVQVKYSKVEDLKLVDNEKVDIIISEWMGFYLLHEGMLDSVLYARDNFLKPEGCLFPQSASISAALCRLPSLFDQWSNIHGVSMNCFGSHLRKQMCEKPEIMTVLPEHILTKPEVICWLDLKTITLEDLQKLSAQFISVTKEKTNIQGLCIWFQCQFGQNSVMEKLELSTSPFDENTHWKQTVIVLPEEKQVEEGEPLAWNLDICRSVDCRKYNLELSLIDANEIEHPLPCDCWKTTCILTKKHLETFE
ncbi:protein arginine N-methyltransferase 6 [Ctenocephalides felis]|uniref:protein arginine N-methyltransferase 6 n=1 Tax=Ctenocephalides felis TaxID=7515 RepID=UPI000E6E462B|nr:protein arginine N-methyltransferase 6 [Ctenocephalides felis]